MRIAHVLPMVSWRFGGPVAGVLDSAEALVALGHDVTVFSTTLGRVPWSGDRREMLPEEMPEVAAGVDVELFEVKEPLRLMYSPAMKRRLGAVIDQFDVLHVHSLWLYPQFAAQRAARRSGVPYVVSPHGSLDPYLRSRGRARKALSTLLWQRGMMKHAAVLHITTEEEGRLISDVVPEVPHVLVPNGVWVDRFREADGNGERFRKKHLDGFEGPLVMFFSRVNYKKGVDILIRSMSSVLRRVPSAHLAIVGPDDEGLTSSLERLVASLNLESRVTFTGPLFGPERDDALAAADVWALPSHTENFGIAVVEAMAAGLATVISPDVNLAAGIERAGAGLVVRQEPGPFGDAIASVLTEPELRRTVETNALDYVRKFDWNNIATDYVDMYASCL